MRALQPGEIRACATGCLSWVETQDGLEARRLPDRTLAFYRASEGARIRSLCPAGVVLDFMTDSPRIAVRGQLGEGARAYARLDLVEDGLMVDSVAAADGAKELSGVFSGSVVGKRRCRLYLPHVRRFVVQRVKLDDGATFEPFASSATLLAIGDSITQGMTTLHPSLTFAAVAARDLGLTLHNAGIGGAKFEEASLPEAPCPNPSAITVAFGTNDWKGGLLPECATPYLARLREWYPRQPIAVLEPLYREGGSTCNSVGMTLKDYRVGLREAASGIAGVTVVPSSALLPSSSEWLIDGTHPNDAGHLLYGANLSAALQGRHAL